MKYQPTIGLEIHLHLKTKSKMFCSCANDDLAKANTNICPVCTAQPGALPVINQQAIDWTALLGLALHSEIAPRFNFERKNYFYPDLPKGYQITSSSNPPCIGGYVQVGDRQIHLNHIHLEEDTGRLHHDTENKNTLVDLNRAGAPLVELVTEPEITSGAQAKAFCQELQLILRCLGIADADMEKGQMRCEVNVSLRPNSSKKLGTKVEVKNLNSFRAVERSIDYEIKRQTEILAAGQKVSQENRGWRDDQNQTVSQRVKEEAHDYRYFPEPDLPPITFDQDHYEKLRAKLPELPIQKRQRFITEYGFNPEDAYLLTTDLDLADYTEKVVSELQEWITSVEGVEGSATEIWDNNKKKIIKILSGWLTSSLFMLLNEAKIKIKDLKITPENLAELVTLAYQNKVNNLTGKKILKIMFDTGGDPSHIMEDHDLSQTSDSADLKQIIAKIIADNPKQLADYRAGKVVLFQYFVGQVMRQTKGTADPEIIHKLLKEKLD
ncbi:MAG: Asp-tRNA(Asn)/Glu-tRNA(Gln) amidotransferase subunit GatB [Patescibacteria group bacterium]